MSRRWPLRFKTAWPYLIALAALAARLLPGPRTIDDAFITFRYARNVLAGQGFVYNPGERVLGTTTPLYTLLMAVIAGATGFSDYPQIARLVNALADTLTCLLLFRLGKKISGHRGVGLAAAALWAIGPVSITFAIGGMETSVFILLLVLGAALYLEGHSRWAALTCALLVLTRPDGLIFVGPVALDVAWRGWRKRKIPWGEGAVFLLTLAPWAVFAALYFGSPIPHSLAAKSLAYRLGPTEALIRLIQHYSTPFFDDLMLEKVGKTLWGEAGGLLGAYWRLAGFFVYLLVGLAGGWLAQRRDSRAWVITAYPWLYFAAFAAAAPLIFRWYLAPPLPFYFLLILAGIAKLADDLESLRLKAQDPSTTSRFPFHVSRFTSYVSRFTFYASRLLLPACFVFFLIFSLNEWVLHPDHGPQSPAPEMAWHKLELLYANVAQKLVAEQKVNSDTLLAAGDVGVLGYYTQARILDTVGLMSPEASAYYPLDPAFYVINYAVPPQLILRYQPDFVVLLEVYGRKGLFIQPEFQAQYQLVEKVPSDIYGSDGLLIFRRR